MKNLTYLLLASVLFFSNACSLKNSGKSSTASDKEMVRIKEIEKSDKIVWLSYDEAVMLSQKKPKKIFVDVYTNWCGWCKRMDATTLRDPNIVKYMNEKFYAVKLNAESGKKVVYKGNQISESDLASNIFKASGYPTTVYLLPNEEILQPIPGYLDVDMLGKILHFYGDEHFKTTSWDKYNMSQAGVE
jgi:thioredoxin-related protein